MLSLEGVTHRYGGTLALAGVDFSVDAGAVHGLIGHNGAGKSTLIKCMAGILSPDGGQARIAGQSLSFGSPATAYRAGLRFIHQNAPLVPVFDAVENCFLGRPYPRRNGLIDRRAMRREVQAVAGELAPDLPLDVPASALSAGMRQLVQIVRALCDRGRVLVLDEPTASLSAAETDRLLQAIATLRAQGLAIVFVSHRLDEVLRVADRVTCLKDGAVSATSRAGDVGVPDLVRMIGGDEAVAAERPAKPRREGADAAGLIVTALQTRPDGPALDFMVGAGEVVVLYGRTGSGRSGLLDTLWSGRRPHAGRMTLAGRPYHPKSPRAAIAQGVAYVPDDRRRKGIFVGLPLVGNMTLPRLRAYRTASWLPVPDPRREDDAFQSAARGLHLVFDKARQAAGTLSGGNQQKLLFARWLDAKPSLLLLDEPTEGVDVAAKAEIHGLIRRAADQGAAVLAATSDRDEALALGDRFLLMRDGEIVREFNRLQANPDVLETAAQAAADQAAA